jgi:hypothetical protein
MLSIHLRLGLRSGLFPSGFPTNNLYTFLFSLIRATCPAHLGIYKHKHGYRRHIHEHCAQNITRGTAELQNCRTAFADRSNFCVCSSVSDMPRTVHRAPSGSSIQNYVMKTQETVTQYTCMLSSLERWAARRRFEVKALRGFLPAALRPGVYSASDRNEYRKQKNDVSVE